MRQVQAFPDFPVGQALGGEPGDLQFLRDSTSCALGSWAWIRSPAARSSDRACSAQLRAPIRSKVIWAERSGGRACVTRRWRRSHRP